MKLTRKWKVETVQWHSTRTVVENLNEFNPEMKPSFRDYRNLETHSHSLWRILK